MLGANHSLLTSMSDGRFASIPQAQLSLLSPTSPFYESSSLVGINTYISQSPCPRICPRPVATSLCSTAATSPPEAFALRLIWPLSAPSAPTASGEWDRESENKSMRRVFLFVRLLGFEMCGKRRETEGGDTERNMTATRQDEIADATACGREMAEK